MADVAFIGLGKLGLPMAARLAAAGHQVRGLDRAPERNALARTRGIVAGTDPAEALGAATFVFTSLPDDRALVGTLGAEGELTGKLPAGAVLIETSTVSPEASAAIAAGLAGRGLAYLRSPVSGNPVLAEAGTLTALVSGPREAFAAAQPALAAFTRSQAYLGTGEEARFAKLAINLMIAASAGMMADALVLAEKGGVPWDAMLDAMADSAAGSPMVKYKVPPLKARDYASTFSCRQMAKDLDLILGAAAGTGLTLPYGELTRRIYGALIDGGQGDVDFIATVAAAEERAGLAPAGPALKE